MKKYKNLSFILFLFLMSCEDHGVEVVDSCPGGSYHCGICYDDNDSCSYNSLLTIFTAHCSNCHIGSSSGGLNLSTCNDLMSFSGAVVAGDHLNSTLYERISSLSSATGHMPPDGNLHGYTDLITMELSLIEIWINSCAP